MTKKATPAPAAEPDELYADTYCCSDCDGCDCGECGDCEALEAPAAAVEAPVEAPAAPAPAKDTYTVRDGDTYASIAAALAPAGTSKHTAAINLLALNRGRTLSPGIEIKVN